MNTDDHLPTKLTSYGTKNTDLCDFKHPLYTDKGTTNLYNMGGYYSRGVVAFIVNTGILHNSTKSMQGSRFGMRMLTRHSDPTMIEFYGEHMRTTTTEDRGTKSGISTKCSSGCRRMSIFVLVGVKERIKLENDKNKKSKRNYRQIGNKSRKNRRIDKKK